ncbi:metallophosphoesterase [Desulfocurvus sp. DL9XJH121]
METFDKYWIGVGDVHDEPANLERIPGAAGAEGIIVSGDITTHDGVPGAKRAIERMRAVNPNIMAQIGNMDGPAVQDWLEAEGLNIHNKALELAPGIGIMGLGWSSPTPFGTRSEVPDERLGKWLDETHAKAGAWAQLLLVSHTPPMGTRTDDLGGGRHVGSQAVRAFIERVRPTACLTGHIHEARSQDDLAGTRIVNPGMLALGGYALIGLKDGTLSMTLQTL